MKDQNQGTEQATALDHLKQGNLLVFPSEVGWVLATDACRSNGVQRALGLHSGFEASKACCLVSGDRMLEGYVNALPEVAYDLIDCADTPLTLILDGPRQLAPELISGGNPMAFRLVRDSFTLYLLNRLKRPLLVLNQKPWKDLTEIPKEILKGSDYVVNLPRSGSFSSPGSSIKLSMNGEVRIISQ